jgi:hypothetical protein
LQLTSKYDRPGRGINNPKLASEQLRNVKKSRNFFKASDEKGR